MYQPSTITDQLPGRTARAAGTTAAVSGAATAGFTGGALPRSRAASAAALSPTVPASTTPRMRPTVAHSAQAPRPQQGDERRIAVGALGVEAVGVESD